MAVVTALALGVAFMTLALRGDLCDRLFGDIIRGQQVTNSYLPFWRNISYGGLLLQTRVVFGILGAILLAAGFGGIWHLLH